MSVSYSSVSKPQPIRVFGLSHEELEALRELAYQKYGKASISLLARKLLQAQLNQPTEPEPVNLPAPRHRKRITLRLPDKDRAYLEAAAVLRRGSINDVARDIIQSHIYRHPMLSAYEADALYQSNYQLLRIGRNLNQIARQLNAGEQASLSWQQLNELMEFIRRHTEQANRVLQTRRRRLRK